MDKSNNIKAFKTLIENTQDVVGTSASGGNTQYKLVDENDKPLTLNVFDSGTVQLQGAGEKGTVAESIKLANKIVNKLEGNR